MKSIEEETIYIDGFNVIIGLEIASSKSMLFNDERIGDYPYIDICPEQD